MYKEGYLTELDAKQIALNSICPYFTMFPLQFPQSILNKHAQKGDRILDPFCGRGTTNFAARLSGLSSLGVDSNPVAAAITAAKLVTTTPEDILGETRRILRKKPRGIPKGEFWQWAFHQEVLNSICRLREAFMEDCESAVRIALRGIILGALHGPKQKTIPGYFSNQSPRTYAPKPAYATRWWRDKGLVPEPVDAFAVIKRRAKRYYGVLTEVPAAVRLADSRDADALQPEPGGTLFNWVITSPPYYGMSTYIPDQWLRNWFLGGSDIVDYSSSGQIVHSNRHGFINDLRRVWLNAAGVCAEDARMVIRFGGVANKGENPLALIESSLKYSGWSITKIRRAGSADEGRRQADAFLRSRTAPLNEYDVWAVRNCDADVS